MSIANAQFARLTQNRGVNSPRCQYKNAASGAICVDSLAGALGHYHAVSVKNGTVKVAKYNGIFHIPIVAQFIKTVNRQKELTLFLVKISVNVLGSSGRKTGHGLQLLYRCLRNPLEGMEGFVERSHGHRAYPLDRQ